MVKFWRVLEKDLRSPVPYVVWFLLTVLFGLSGPFGSYEVLPLLPRVAFWAVGTALSIWAGLAIRALVYGGLGLKKFRDGAVLTAVLVCLVLTGPLLVVVDRFVQLIAAYAHTGRGGDLCLCHDTRDRRLSP